MEGMEQRLLVLETAVKQVPQDLIDNWENAKEAIKTMNKQIQNIQEKIDEQDMENRDELKTEMDEVKKKFGINDEQHQEIVARLKSSHEDLKSRFAMDLKELNEKIEGNKQGKDGYSWEKKVKDARDEKPKEWKDGDKAYAFEIFAKSVRRWGNILSDQFDKMLDRVELAPLDNNWEDIDFEGVNLESGEWQRMSKELYKILDSQIAEDATAKQYIRAVKDKEGFTAWRSLIGRYDSRRTMDETIEWHKLIQPQKYIGRAKTTDAAMDNIKQWENDIHRHSVRFGQTVDAKTIMCMVRELVPERLFGDTGPFRGKKHTSWEEMRSEIMTYCEDKPSSEASKNEGPMRTLQQPEPTSTQWQCQLANGSQWQCAINACTDCRWDQTEQGEWLNSLVKGGGKGGKSKGKGKGETRECYECGKTGHLAFNCWNKGKGNGGKGKGDDKGKGKGKGDWGKGKGKGKGNGYEDWSKGKGKGKGKSNITCYTCGCTGHMGKDGQCPRNWWDWPKFGGRGLNHVDNEGVEENAPARDEWAEAEKEIEAGMEEGAYALGDDEDAKDKKSWSSVVRGHKAPKATKTGADKANGNVEGRYAAIRNEEEYDSDDDMLITHGTPPG